LPQAKHKSDHDQDHPPLPGQNIFHNDTFQGPVRDAPENPAKESISRRLPRKASPKGNGPDLIRKHRFEMGPMTYLVEEGAKKGNQPHSAAWAEP
jgi:hypothetical protein